MLETVMVGPVLADLAVKILVGAASLVVVKGLGWVTKMIGRYLKKTPEVLHRGALTDNSLMRSEDLAMIKRSQEILGVHFGPDLVKGIKSMNAEQRVNAMEPLIKELVAIYGIDAPEVHLIHEESLVYGDYDRNKNLLTLNTAFLLSDDKKDIRAFLETLFHELRHAVQYRMVKEPEFWGAPKELRAKLAYNFLHYIRADQNPQGYARQLVEQDAITYAHLIMEGPRHA